MMKKKAHPVCANAFCAVALVALLGGAATAAVATEAELPTLDPAAQGEGASEAERISLAGPDAGEPMGPETVVSVGFALGGEPRYLGSDEMKLMAQPMLGVRHGMFYLDSIQGGGIEYVTPAGLTLRAGLNYDDGRLEEKSLIRPGSESLKGMGRIGGTVLLELQATLPLTPWLDLDAAADFGLSGYEDRGNRYRLGLITKPWMTETDLLTFGFDVYYTDKDYNQTYFGVTEAQSQRTRFAPYTVDAGVSAYAVSAGWMHQFDQHWSSFAGVEVLQFSNRIKQSPVVLDKTQVVAGLGLTYSFVW